MDNQLILAPTTDPTRFRAPDGRLLTPPLDWACLPPGDAGLTRRVKASGSWWQVIEVRGRKKFSRGLWAPAAIIEAARAGLESERATPTHARRLSADSERRERRQQEFVAEFETAVRAFLRFDPMFTAQAEALAKAVTVHAVPVGSGTVARSARLTTAAKAEAAVLAWMRHQTTDYDRRAIARVKGRRREVRRELAVTSRRLLDAHRRPAAHPAVECALCQAVAGLAVPEIEDAVDEQPPEVAKLPRPEAER